MRDKGQGTIRQRSDGTFEARLQLEGRGTSGYRKSKQQIKRKLDQARQQAIITGGLPGNRTLYQLLGTWYSIGEPYS